MNVLRLGPEDAESEAEELRLAAKKQDISPPPRKIGPLTDVQQAALYNSRKRRRLGPHPALT